jgi:hypothetical protein
LAKRDRVRDAQVGRQRTRELPALSSMVNAKDRDELAMTVAQAADVLECSQQNINQRILSGALPAYRGPDGNRWLLVVDLCETAASKKQARRWADERMRESGDRIRHNHPMPAHLLPEGTGLGCGPTCTECARLADPLEARETPLCYVGCRECAAKGRPDEPGR